MEEHTPIGIYVFAFLCILLGGYISASNWTAPFLSTKERHVSMIPLFGAVILALGLFTLPWTTAFWWVAFLVDLGTIWLVISLPLLIKQIWAHSTFNLRYQFVASTNEKMVTVKLFSGGSATIEQRFVPGAVQVGSKGVPVALGGGGNWSEEEGLFTIHLFGGERLFFFRRTAEVYLAEETTDLDEGNKHAHLGGLEFRLR